MSAAVGGRGLAAEVALARPGDAPMRGNTHSAWRGRSSTRCRNTLAALQCGALSEMAGHPDRPGIGVPGVEHRGQWDADLCADISKLAGWGNARVEAEAKRIAARLDAAAVVARSAKAAEDRCVTIRPAPDTMTYVTVLLPVGRRALRSTPRSPGGRHHVRRSLARPGDGRHRGRAGHRQAADQPVPVALNLVMAIPPSSAGRCAGLAGELPARSWRVGLRADQRRRGRRIRQGRSATAVPASGQRATGRHGIAVADLPERVWPRSSACATRPAAPRTAMPRSGIATTPCRNARAGHQRAERSRYLRACNYTKEARGGSSPLTTPPASTGGPPPDRAVYRSTAPPLPGVPVRIKLSLVEGRLSVDLRDLRGRLTPHVRACSCASARASAASTSARSMPRVSRAKSTAMMVTTEGGGQIDRDRHLGAEPLQQGDRDHRRHRTGDDRRDLDSQRTHRNSASGSKHLGHDGRLRGRTLSEWIIRPMTTASMITRWCPLSIIG